MVVCSQQTVHQCMSILHNGAMYGLWFQCPPLKLYLLVMASACMPQL